MYSFHLFLFWLVLQQKGPERAVTETTQGCLLKAWGIRYRGSSAKLGSSRQRRDRSPSPWCCEHGKKAFGWIEAEAQTAILSLEQCGESWIQQCPRVISWTTRHPNQPVTFHPLLWMGSGQKLLAEDFFFNTCQAFSLIFVILLYFSVSLWYSKGGGRCCFSRSPVLRDALALNPQTGQSWCLPAALRGKAALLRLWICVRRCRSVWRAVRAACSRVP